MRLKHRRAITGILWRCLALRCPACGQSTIVERPFQIKNHCPACGALFKREEGFFVGAIMANVVATQFAILAAYLICLPALGANYRLIIMLLLAVALLFPLAFYHHSWSAWLSLDHLIETLPQRDKTRR